MAKLFCSSIHLPMLNSNKQAYKRIFARYRIEMLMLSIFFCELSRSFPDSVSTYFQRIFSNFGAWNNSVCAELWCQKVGCHVILIFLLMFNTKKKIFWKQEAPLCTHIETRKYFYWAQCKMWIYLINYLAVYSTPTKVFFYRGRNFAGTIKNINLLNQ